MIFGMIFLGLDIQLNLNNLENWSISIGYEPFQNYLWARVKVMLRVRGGVRVSAKVTVSVRVRLSAKVRVIVRVIMSVRMRVRIMERVKIRVRVEG